MSREMLRAYIVSLALLVATCAVLAWKGTARVDSDLPLAAMLPERVGAYRGVSMLFCQSDQCSRGFRVDSLTNTNTCPVCGSVLDTKALAERRILPADTTILRKAYVDDSGPAFTVAVVVSGVSRQSIHPPQVCLVAQGYTILSERVIPVKVGRAEPLGVKRLDLKAAVTLGGGRALYAYWFLARGRETPYHLQRMLWTAWDGIVHGIHRRWAYVAVTTERPSATAAHAEELEKFLAELYPLLRPAP